MKKLIDRRVLLKYSGAACFTACYPFQKEFGAYGPGNSLALRKTRISARAILAILSPATMNLVLIRYHFGMTSPIVDASASLNPSSANSMEWLLAEKFVKQRDKLAGYVSEDADIISQTVDPGNEVPERLFPAMLPYFLAVAVDRGAEILRDPKTGYLPNGFADLVAEIRSKQRPGET